MNSSDRSKITCLSRCTRASSQRVACPNAADTVREVVSPSSPGESASQYPTSRSSFDNSDKTSHPAEAPSDDSTAAMARSPARSDRSKQNQLPPCASSSGGPARRAKSEVLCWYPLGISINQHTRRRPVARARPVDTFEKRQRGCCDRKPDPAP